MMQKEKSLTELSRLFDAFSECEDQSLESVLEKEGIDPKRLEQEGLKRIKNIRRSIDSIYQSEGLVKKALLKWKEISNRFSEDISREIEPLLLNSNKNGLKLFFQSMNELENQKELEIDSAKMELEIAIFRLKQNLEKNQSDI